MRSIGRRLNPLVNQLIICGHAVKTLESKETRASKEITVTHNSVFAAHRLQCRMTNRKNRHPAFCLYRKIESGKRELRKTEKLRLRSRLHAISQSAKHVRQQAAN